MGMIPSAWNKEARKSADRARTNATYRLVMLAALYQKLRVRNLTGYLIVLQYQGIIQEMFQVSLIHLDR